MQNRRYVIKALPLIPLSVVGLFKRLKLSFQKIREYNTGNSSELITRMQFTDTSNKGLYGIIYSLKIPSVSSDDLILVLSELQVSHSLETNVMFVSYLNHGKSKHITLTDITEANGFNMTSQELKKATVVKHGFFSPNDDDYEFINFISYAASSYCKGRYFNIDVHQDFGRLSAIQFPKSNGIKAYQSPQSGELIDRLLIGGSNIPVNKKSILSVKLNELNLEIGDILVILSEHQFSNKTGYSVSAHSQIILTNTQYSTFGIPLTNKNGMWITNTSPKNSMHHAFFAKNSTITVTDAMLNKGNYVNLISWARSSASYGESLYVDKDYGRLSVLHFKPSKTLNILELNSGFYSEKVDSIPIKSKNPPKKVIYSISLNKTTLNKDDIIVAFAECQTTNKTNEVLSIVSQIVLTNSSYSTSGIEITEANAFYSSKYMQNAPIIKNGSYTISESDAGGNYTHLNLVVWVRSNNANGKTLTIQKNYGNLSALLIRP